MSEKGITQQELDDLQEVANALEAAFNDFDTALRDAAPQMYERWKAYGKQVSNEFVSMGPNMHEVMEQLAEDIVPDDEDDEQPDHDASDELCTCGDPDCSRPTNHE